MTEDTVTLSFTDVLEMTLQFILAGKVIVASIFASNHKTGYMVVLVQCRDL
jgi:hypothetical protein